MKVLTLCVFGCLAVLSGPGWSNVGVGEARVPVAPSSATGDGPPPTTNVQAAESSQSPFAKEFQIEIDATALTPPIVWAINGVTESIQSLHPLTTDKKTALKLRPGRYYYTTSRFSFEFTVDLEGKLDFKKTLDQCIEGRGTSSLTVTCSRTQIF